MRITHHERTRFQVFGSAEQMFFRKKAAFKRRPMSLASGSRSLQLTFGWGMASINHGPVIHVTINGAPACAQLTEPMLNAITDGPLDIVEEFEQALILEDAIAPWLDAVEAKTGVSIQFKDIKRDGLTHHAHCIIVSIGLMDKDEHTHSFPLYLSQEASEPCLQFLESHRASYVARAKLDLNAPYVIFSHIYDYKTLSSIKVGDSILTGLCDTPDRVLIDDTLCFPVMRVGQKLSITGEAQSLTDLERQPMSALDEFEGPQDDIENPQDDGVEDSADDFEAEDHEDLLPTRRVFDGAPERLDTVKLVLNIVAGSVALPLGKLEDLTVGSLLDLTGGAGDVDLVVNGQKIGEGVIVTIADRQAVEVTRLAT